MKLKTAEEIALIQESAQIVSRTLGLVAENIEPGISSAKLDQMAEEFIRDNGGVPSFKGYRGFPASLCMSADSQVVHGFPNDKPLKEGTILSVDCGVYKNGFHGDHAYTFMVGEVPEEVRQLLRVTKECLYLGLAETKAGNRIGDIAHAIESHAKKYRYGVVRELVGHGLGKDIHEKPEVPNYGKKGKGPLLKEGLVLAVEPMINMGSRNVQQLNDGWTIITKDRKPSAHFEHNVAVGNSGPQLLSTFHYVEEALEKRGYDPMHMGLPNAQAAN